MIELHSQNWKKFLMSDLFYIKGISKRKDDIFDCTETGMYPVLSTKATNNGVAGFSDTYTELGGVLVIETACIGYCSYQKQNFSGTGHLAVLRPKTFEMNDRIALFLVTVLNRECKFYNYGRKRTLSRIKASYIYLPSKYDKEHSKFMPDFQFMDQYMKSLLQGSDQRRDGGVKLIFSWNK